MVTHQSILETQSMQLSEDEDDESIVREQDKMETSISYLSKDFGQSLKSTHQNVFG